MVVAPFVKRLMHLDELRDDELAGYREIGDENEAAGMFPGRETKQGPQEV
jgi:POT family proton-dependent oligopeptide transporter